MERETINIPAIMLEWSNWYRWDEFKVDARSGGGVLVPNKAPGVYEAKRFDSDNRLTIGKASDLRLRIKQGLVKGKVPQSAGKRIRANEDTSKIVIRWATTDRPSAAEEELHRKHQEMFGAFPVYTEHT